MKDIHGGTASDFATLSNQIKEFKGTYQGQTKVRTPTIGDYRRKVHKIVIESPFMKKRKIADILEVTKERVDDYLKKR